MAARGTLTETDSTDAPFEIHGSLDEPDHAARLRDHQPGRRASGRGDHRAGAGDLVRRPAQAGLDAAQYRLSGRLVADLRRYRHRRLGGVEVGRARAGAPAAHRSEEPPSELQSLMRISYAL